MDQTPQKYPEREPEFETAGSFEAWIAASKHRSGVSAMSFLIRRADGSGKEIEHCWPSSASDSNEQRAYLQGARASCEACPPASTLTICSRSNYISDVLENGSIWKESGWRNSSGDVPHRNVIEQIQKVVRERGLRVSTRHCPKDGGDDDKIIKRLTAKARKKARGE